MTPAGARDPLGIAVVCLGIAQITSWGTGYYFLGVLASAIQAETGWTKSLVYLGFTTGLLTMGIVSTWVGRLIDRLGARTVMAIGTLIASVAMVGIGMSRSETAYLLVWACLGVGLRMTLYDAAFAALVQVVPTRGRQAISYLTLFGAFASTVFWVIAHYLNELSGWRETLIWFAVINLVVCLPLNWIGLAYKEQGEHAGTARPHADTTTAPLTGTARRIAMWLYALVMSLNAFVFGVVSVQLVPLLEGAGLATAVAVWIASMKGFAQFGGRLVEIVFGKNLRAITVARIAIGVLPFAFGLLLVAQGQTLALLVFTLLAGASQGVVTIVRGALPLALFGSEGFGAVLGLLATPILIVNAASPTAFALIVEQWGWTGAQAVLVATAAASWIAMELMAYWCRRVQVR
jgi:hypothetical protein